MSGEDIEDIEREVRDLILHFKSKRTTDLEPCKEENLSEYLNILKEELSLHGIKLIFNQFTDLKGSQIVQVLVRLVNAVWNLLILYKDVLNNGNKLKERNYALQQNNFYLNNLVDKLKRELEASEAKCKTTDVNNRRISSSYDSAQKETTKLNEEVKKLRKQLSSREDQLTKQIKKLKFDYSALQEKMRGNSGVFVSRNEAKNLAIDEYKIREEKYRDTIKKLQENNRRLLLEVVNLKESILSDDSN